MVKRNFPNLFYTSYPQILCAENQGKKVSEESEPKIQEGAASCKGKRGGPDH